MFTKLLGRAGKANRSITDALYGEIVAAARQPVLYSAWNVPDTPLGRFEMLSLHMVLFLRRLQEDISIPRALGQDVTDAFFRDLDHSLRELGIGDLSVPKRIKKLARMFYGRANAYADALARLDRPGMATALARNVRPDLAEWRESEALALYAFAAAEALDAAEPQAILAGRLEFPAAAALVQGEAP